MHLLADIPGQYEQDYSYLKSVVFKISYIFMAFTKAT